MDEPRTLTGPTYLTVTLVFTTKFPVFLQSDLTRARLGTGSAARATVVTQKSLTAVVSVLCLHRTVYSVAYRQVSRVVSASYFYPECCPGWRRFHSHNCNQGTLERDVMGETFQSLQPKTQCQTVLLISSYSCVWTSLCEWRYLLETQPVCLSVGLDGFPVPNRYTDTHIYLHNRIRSLCTSNPTRTNQFLCLSSLSDVDECSTQQPCAQECVNTAGSYRCACGDGFKLAGDGRSCQSLPPPPLPPRPPTQPSQTTVGGHTDAGK